MKRYSFKIIFIGATGCGKTSIINVSNKEPFCNLFTSTIGVDFMSLNIEREGICYNLKIWDTGGHDRFNFLIKSYYRKISAIVITYDINNLHSFNIVENLINEYYDNTGNTRTPILLLGNKTDLESTRVVTTEMGETLAERYNCIFLECSAKTYNNINFIYFMLIDKINKMIEEQNIKITDIENEYGIKYIKNNIQDLKIEDTGTILNNKCCTIL
jgi:small GTP-binding protein